MPADRVIHPKFHHVNLKTTRLQEMIDWYSALVGAEVLFQYPLGAWLSNDAANHRIALTAFPGFVEDPEKDTRAGLHHTAFEYAGFEELNESYLRLKAAGIVPAFCLDHGMTLSYYYRDRTATTSRCRSTTSAIGRRRARSCARPLSSRPTGSARSSTRTAWRPPPPRARASRRSTPVP